MKIPQAHSVGVTFDAVRKVFDDGTVAVDDFTLAVRPGEFLVLVGPSGCGKTTALRMAAGLEAASEGTITIDGRDVTNVDPAERDLAMVFQNYALYPHMDVAHNLGFALRMRKLDKRVIREEVARVAQLLGLEAHLARKPAELSGGQRQRVAMGRAIVRQPKAFLMDEPLSNLDAQLRVQMRAEIARLQADLGVTTIYVTHDQTEAMTMADRVTIMQKGRIQQVGSPEELYNHPSNLFVASFMGSPPMNLLSGLLESRGESLAFQFGRNRVPLDATTVERHRALGRYTGRRVVVGIRPESVRRAPDDHNAAVWSQPGRVVLVEALGAERLVYVELDMPPSRVDENEGENGTAGIAGQSERAVIIGRFAPEGREREGDRLEVTFDPRALRFFDPETGQAIRK